MKKNDFKKMALLGLASGCLLSSQNATAEAAKDGASTELQDNGNIGYHLFTEDELMLELNDEGAKTYNSLTPEGKALARKLASQRCNATNDCAGQNACRTEKNECAGKGACKGKSKCSFSDKNLAVKVASELMKKKREKASAQ